MPSLDFHGQTLAYRDQGRGQPVVLLSANPGDSRDFDAVAPALAARFRVIRPDWPGYGASPAPQPPERAGAGYCLELLAALMDTLALERAHLVGNSMGGNVAVRYALAHPQRVASLVLVSAGGFTRYNAMSRLFCRLMAQPGFNHAVRGTFTRTSLPTRNAWTEAMIARALGEQATPGADRVNAAGWRSFLAPEHDLREAARALQVPALVINGGRDKVLPAHRDGRCAARAIAGARLLVPDCGHAPFAECPEWFLDAALPFLEAADTSAVRNAAA